MPSTLKTIVRGLENSRPKSDSKTSYFINKNDVFGGDSSENSYFPPRIYYYIVRIDSEPVCMDTVKSGDPNVRATKGSYTIQYIPESSPLRHGKFAYLIGQDLVRLRVIVSGYKHWSALASRIPELNWLKRNSTLTPGLFGIAKKHPGMIMRFTIDYEKYCDMITRKAEKQGIDIDHKPLVSYVYSQDVYEKYKDKKFASIRTKQDYLDEIEAAKAEAEGNDEN